MFHAFIIVCASAANLEVYTDTCFRMDDAWGPYKTEENCGIRSNQMKEEVLYGPLNETVFFALNNPPLIYVESLCEQVELDPAV